MVIQILLMRYFTMFSGTGKTSYGILFKPARSADASQTPLPSGKGWQ